MPVSTIGTVNRELTAQVYFRTLLKTEDVIKCLKVDFFAEGAIKCVQFHGIGKYQITFGNKCFLDQATEVGFKVGAEVIYANPLVKQWIWMTVVGAPFEMDSKIIDQVLRGYGIVHQHELVYPVELQGWSNGDRRVRITMKTNVPNMLQVGPYQLTCVYEGVTKQCRRCHEAGHIVVECKKRAECYNCGSDRHLERNCTVTKMKFIDVNSEVHQEEEDLTKLVEEGELSGEQQYGDWKQGKAEEDSWCGSSGEEIDVKSEKEEQENIRSIREAFLRGKEISEDVNEMKLGKNTKKDKRGKKKAIKKKRKEGKKEESIQRITSLHVEQVLEKECSKPEKEGNRIGKGTGNLKENSSIEENSNEEMGKELEEKHAEHVRERLSRRGFQYEDDEWKELWDNRMERISWFKVWEEIGEQKKTGKEKIKLLEKYFEIDDGNLEDLERYFRENKTLNDVWLEEENWWKKTRKKKGTV